MAVHPTQAQRAAVVAVVAVVAAVAEVTSYRLEVYRLEATLLHKHYPSSSVTSAVVGSCVAGHQMAPVAYNSLASLAALASV